MTEELARHHHDEYRRLFECLLAAEGGFLLHCSAGKDRTGFGAAMILRALGVPRPVVVQDYLLTNRARWQLPDDVIPVDSLPLTSTGKLDKKTIRAQLAEEGYKLPDLR